MKTFRFWTDAGDQDSILAETLGEAALKAAKQIPDVAWEDGAWGFVSSEEEGTLRVYQIDDEPYSEEEQREDADAMEALQRSEGESIIGIDEIL
jgi:hypothetical protein